MTDPSTDPSIDPVDEELTSYLDGELSAAEAANLERKLVDDERMRKRLAHLRKTFELLDDLPDTPHNQQFTRSTIEMVVADFKQSVASVAPLLPMPLLRPSWWRWPRILVVSMAMLFAGAIVGFGTAALRIRADLRQLDLIANVNGLQDTHEISVIKELAKDHELIEFLSAHFADKIIPDIPKSLWLRKNWVQSLNSRQIVKLDTSRELIERLPLDDKRRLEAIQEQIDQSSDDRILSQTVRLVAHVLDSLPNTKRQDLDSMTSDQRIRLLREQLNSRAAIVYSYELATADAAAVDEWCKQRFIPTLATIIPRIRSEPDIQGQLAVLYSRVPVLEGYRLDNQDELITELAVTLSPFGRRLLEGIDRNDQLYVLTNWLLQGGMDSNQWLVGALEGIRRDAREEIELMDPNQSKRILQERRRRAGTGTRNR